MTDINNGQPLGKPPAEILAEAAEGLLSQQAFRDYNGDALSECIEPFQALISIKKDRGDLASETDYRFWLGTALHGCGRLIEAAEAMAPALEQSAFVGSRVLQNRLLTRFLLVCVDIPLTLERIEAAFSQVQQVINGWAWENKESRLVYAMGRLAYYRGEAQEAINLSRIAMDRSVGDPSNYAPHTYLHLYLRVCLMAGRIDLLKELLDSGASFRHSNFRTTQQLTVNAARAEVSHLEGDTAQALDQSKVAEELAWSTKDFIYRQLGFMVRTRQLLAAGQPERAKPLLINLLSRRRGENLHDGFESRLLLGDYHLAQAKIARDRGTAREVRRQASSASGVYAAAGRFGAAVDERLRCRHKTGLAEGRLKEVQDFLG